MMNDSTSVPIEFKVLPVGIAMAVAAFLQFGAAAAWKRCHLKKAIILNVSAISVFGIGCLVTKHL